MAKTKAQQVFPDPKYASIATYNPHDNVRFEYNSGKKITVEGESYTIQELWARHANKHDPALERSTFFADTEDFDSIDLSKLGNMDLHDRQVLYEEVTEKARKALEKIAEHKKALEEVETQESDERSVETQQELHKPHKPEGAKDQHQETT